MSIIRRKRADNFTVIPNYIMEDENLSFEARGLLCYLLTRPNNWKVRIEQLKEVTGYGRDKCQRMIREIIEAGYARREIAHDEKGQFVGQDLVIYDEIIGERPEPDFQVDGDRLTDLPAPAKPADGFSGPIIRTENKQKTEDTRTAPKPGTKAEILAALQSHLSPEIAEAYFDHRKAMKKPLTVKAAQLNANEFGRTTNPDAAAELAIRNGWQGFKAEWAKDLPPKEAPEIDWYSRVRSYEITSTWHRELWGPAPGEPGCMVPRELLLSRIQAKGRAA